MRKENLSSLSRIIICYILISLIVAHSYATHLGSNEVKETHQVYLYRLLNWCVVGRGEYTLNEWPLSQFKPILRLTYKNEKEWDISNAPKLDLVSAGDPWAGYNLEFSQITCSTMPKGMGVSNAFLNRVHVKLVPQGNAVPFQGLMIQAVHAPFGLGFPFGVFDTDQEFECKETCEHSHYSRIIGCISRPDISPMHPTVAMFHYKLRGLDNKRAIETDRNRTMEYDYQKELHWNFKWANLPCSSSRLVEFWVLMVIDFERRAWSVKKFGPYDFNQATVPFTKLEEPHKTAAEAEGVTDKFLLQPGLPTPIPPECFPFAKNPLIIEKIGRPSSCFRQTRLYDPQKCESWEKILRSAAAAGKTSGSRRAKASGRAPGDPPSEPATPPNPPPSAPAGPTPSAPPPGKNEIECHGSSVTPTDAKAKTRVRIEGDFDVQCTRKYPGDLFEKLTKKSKRQPYKVCPEWQGRFYCTGIFDGDLHYDVEIPDAGPEGGGTRSFPFSHCNECKPVTEEVTEPPTNDVPLFKRTDHGIMMIYAFFFFNPVSLNVARFYKETLHEKQTKGWRLWLMIHVGFAVMASIVAYIGYTFPSFKEIDNHIFLGYGALIGISSGIITGWIRHKNSILQVMMFYLHALSGYLGWALAIASMAFAPGISKWTRLISYCASAICLGAMGIMTLHICTVDGTIGMRPKRSHIPIIEIRFDDIIPPKSKFRKIFLYLYIFIQFAICFGMLVL